MRRRGITLLELLVVTAMIGLIMVGTTQAYVVAIDFEERMRTSREEGDRFRVFEERIASLLKQTYVNADTGDTASYFIAGDPQGAASESLIDTITFTTVGKRLPGVVFSSGSDFETLNSNYGPQGGVAEVTLGMTAVAAPGTEDGLFLREQRPPDGDPTQGGFEKLLVDDLSEISFEFYDGLSWVTTWDTREMTAKRIPSAIRVTYKLNEDDEDRSFIVKLPLSDVTPTNPLTVEGAE